VLGAEPLETVDDEFCDLLRIEVTGSRAALNSQRPMHLDRVPEMPEVYPDAGSCGRTETRPGAGVGLLGTVQWGARIAFVRYQEYFAIPFE
jgi:hypothetical protein